MAEPIKSALFVDYDSLHRSLGAQNKEAAERLAVRSAAWVAAIESGRLLTAKTGGPVRRRVLLRRCYADPKLLGEGKSALVASGFEIVDAAPLDGRERNAADIGMALDAMDALANPAAYDEFILIAADADLTPILARLKTNNRKSAAFANARSPAAYRAIPDALIEETALLALLSGDNATATADAETRSDAPRAPAAAAVAGDKSDIEMLARKIHNATSVPLFSPRTYADLFRVLAQEVAENGYHFQTTADSVAGRLAAAGRNVTRRQVVFVVKGLALKGHVFSTTDTAERLAEAFREQVLYLIGSQRLELDPREMALLPSWIVGRVSAAVAAAEPEPEPPKPTVEAVKPARKRAKGAQQPKAASAPAERPAPAPAAAPAKAAPTPPIAARESPPAPAPAHAQPSPAPLATTPSLSPFGNGSSRPAPARTIEEIRASVAARAEAMRQQQAARARPAPVQPPPAPAPQPIQATPAPYVPPAPPKAAPVIPRAAPPPPRPAFGTRPPAARPPQPIPRAPAAGRLTGGSEANKEALESSILAAIAQAVDVLVEDSGGTPARNEAPPMASPMPEPKPEPVPSDGGDSSDIGDEIQRIIASYSRARQQGEPH